MIPIIFVDPILRTQFKKRVWTRTKYEQHMWYKSWEFLNRDSCEKVHVYNKTIKRYQILRINFVWAYIYYITLLY